MTDITPISFQVLLDDLGKVGTDYRAAIPDGWRQGRTAYGGVTAGLSLEAAQRSFPDLPPLRSAMVNFIGPVPENPVFTAEILRQGRNVTFVRVDGFADTNVISSITFVFAASRESDLFQDFAAPDTPSPENTPDYVPQQFRHLLPPFLSNFEVRLIEGGRPMTGHHEGLIRVWARHLDPASHNGAVNFLTLGDVLAPAASPLLKSITAISSINWTVNIIPETVTTEDGWWHVETRLTAAQGGYSSQIMRYWNRAGELVAEGTQLVAIFDKR